MISAYDQMEPNREYQASILAIFNEVKRIYPNAYYLWYDWLIDSVMRWERESELEFEFGAVLISMRFGFVMRVFLTW